MYIEIIRKTFVGTDISQINGINNGKRNNYGTILSVNFNFGFGYSVVIQWKITVETSHFYWKYISTFHRRDEIFKISERFF